MLKFFKINQDFREPAVFFVNAPMPAPLIVTLIKLEYFKAVLESAQSDGGIFKHRKCQECLLRC